jgi:hypothetical protein
MYLKLLLFLALTGSFLSLLKSFILMVSTGAFSATSFSSSKVLAFFAKKVELYKTSKIST